jgi:hypothetical protein
LFSDVLDITLNLLLVSIDLWNLSSKVCSCLNSVGTHANHVNQASGAKEFSIKTFIFFQVLIAHVTCSLHNLVCEHISLQCGKLKLITISTVWKAKVNHLYKLKLITISTVWKAKVNHLYLTYSELLILFGGGWSFVWFGICFKVFWLEFSWLFGGGFVAYF